MILIFIIVTLWLNSVAADERLNQGAPACNLDKWTRFKQEFSKNYSNPSQDLQHFQTFCENSLKVWQHNTGNSSSFEMGLNQFSDLSLEERKMIFCLGNKSIFWDKKQSSNQTISRNELKKLFGNDFEVPEELDWSQDASRVSRVRAQGKCGACWAFVTIGLIEGQLKPSTGQQLVELSEQNLIDCDMTNDDCMGGNIDAALEEIREDIGGLMPLAKYPYTSGETGFKEHCKLNMSEVIDFTTKLGDIKELESGNEISLRQVLAKYGPVAASYYSNYDFIDYKSGIFEAEDCPKKGNHAVLIVGYGYDEATGKDYWKIKNSWGEKWGQGGYGLVVRNHNNNCGIATKPIIVYPQGEVT